MLLRYSKVAAITSKLRFYRVVAVLLCITTITIGEGWNYIHNYSLIQFTSNYSDSENSIVERYGTLANSIVDFSTNSGDKKLISNLKYGETISTSNNIQEKPNFIVIQVESMDASVINEKHNGEYVAPFLHSLSQNSIYYPYTLSYHKAGGTSDCEFSIIDSVEPLDNYPAIKIKNYNYPNSMVERLAAQAYSTTAIHGNIASYFNRDTAYPKMGFQEFDDMTKMGLKDVGWGAPDNKVFDYAENKLKTQTGPFFDYIITMTSHGPFTNANYYYHNNNYDDIKDTVVKDYLNSMSYVDKSIGDFVSYVQANLKNTYVLIWGDHTPSISNDIYRQASFIQDNKYFEFVPLMIISPDHRVYKEDKKVASFLDVAPTILNASGIPYEIKTNGENLLDTAALDRDIPFKGSNYSRQSLFDKISSLNN